jgi:hypothetical protein
MDVERHGGSMRENCARSKVQPQSEWGKSQSARTEASSVPAGLSSIETSTEG